jgi:hypothetical protein
MFFGNRSHLLNCALGAIRIAQSGPSPSSSDAAITSPFMSGSGALRSSSSSSLL